MAKTKTTTQERKARQNARKMANGQTAPNETPEQLYEASLNLVEQAQPEEALKKAKQLWTRVRNGGTSQALPALNLLGEISVELGAVDSARGYFEQAAALDPSGNIAEAMGGGAEKFLWLAQLSEEGGKESVQWFEKGVSALQAEIASLDDSKNTAGLDEETLLLMRVEKKRRLANALCSIVEVYMTDLSWEDDAEARCESLVTEAMSVEDETSPEVLQTLASVRLSQERLDDAQAALTRSVQSWSELDPEDPAVPDFATRISLARLLMEAKLEDDAMRVLNRLVLEDDQSVEAWYLGGWCQHLIAEREKAVNATTDGDAASNKDTENALKGSQHWLNRSIKLYQLLDYEDTRLREHAKELVEGIDTVLGAEDEQAEGGDDEDDEWEGIAEDGDVDEEMNDA